MGLFSSVWFVYLFIVYFQALYEVLVLTIAYYTIV